MTGTPRTVTFIAMDRRARSMQALFWISMWSLPLGIGLGAGYWLSDWSTPWLPDTLLILLSLWILGSLGLSVHIAWLRRQHGKITGKKRLRMLLVVLAISALTQLAAGWASIETPLTRLRGNDYWDRIELDQEQATMLGKQLDHWASRVDKIVSAADPRKPLSPEQEKNLTESWVAVLHSGLLLDDIRRFHEDYYRFDLSRLSEEKHVTSFMLSFYAETRIFGEVGPLTKSLLRAPAARKFLDGPHPSHKLPGGTVTALLEDFAGLSDFGRIKAGRAYELFLNELPLMRATRGPAHEIRNQVDQLFKTYEFPGTVSLALQSTRTDFLPAQGLFSKSVLKVQTGVAEWMGDTKLQRPGRYLVSAAQAEALQRQLRPGDILLARKNWYLSNVGLPGFWPHAVLYVGTADELREAFDASPEVLAWMKSRELPQIRFSEYLMERFPDAWREITHGKTTVESVSEGVIQSEMAHVTGDYVAGLRPRLGTAAKARAIDRALQWRGRPDYNFDFTTSHALVCTELVWRSYRGDTSVPGLDLPTISVAGRPTLPAHEFARTFKRELGSPNANFDFIAFYEGHEGQQRALRGDQGSFVDTVSRTKWDFRQK